MISIDKRRVILVPIDNRPVTYGFPQLVARIAGIDVVAPPRSLIGSAKAPTNVEELSEWLDGILKETHPDCLAICLDSLIYGGLVASRLSDDSLETVSRRAKSITKWKKLAANNLKVLAQSSIMRISNNYYSNEEKPYWSKYGREIFSWSELLHREKEGLLADKSQLKEAEEKISLDIRKDYLATRERNFQINLKLTEYARDQYIDFLILGQDDTGKYGLNVMEKEELLADCKRQGILNVSAFAGADEVLMILLCRWLLSSHQRKPHCSVHFNLEQGKATESNYEGQSIEESLKSHIAAATLEVMEEPDATQDFAIVVHTAKDMQGDHIWLRDSPDRRTLNTTQEVERTIKLLEESSVPCVVCDVAYSNGSDPLLAEQLVSRKDLMNKLWGYAGWNTSGNTIGSSLAMGVARWHASQLRSELLNASRVQGDQPHAIQQQDADTNATDNALKQAMFIRFADDWAYQTQVRPQLSEASEQRLKELMAPYLDRLVSVFGFEAKKVRTNFPWQRTFEVEIDVDA